MRTLTGETTAYKKPLQTKIRYISATDFQTLTAESELCHMVFDTLTSKIRLQGYQKTAGHFAKKTSSDSPMTVSKSSSFIAAYAPDIKKGFDQNDQTLYNNWLVSGTPGTIRTCDLRIRSPLLYPAELQARTRMDF